MLCSFYLIGNPALAEIASRGNFFAVKNLPIMDISAQVSFMGYDTDTRNKT